MILQPSPENSIILEQLVEQMDKAFFIYDVAPQKLRYINPAFEEIFETERSSLLTNPESYLASIDPEDQDYVKKRVKSILKQSQLVTEFKHLTPRNKVKWISLQTFHILNEDDTKSIVGIAEDVTNKKVNQATLLKYADKKDTVLHTMSHDLSGPINLIKNLARVIDTESLNYHNNKISEALSYIQQTCEQSIKLITNLLTNEFLESSEIGLRKIRFNLVPKIQNILDAFKSAEINFKRNVKFNYTAEVIYIIADEVKIIQVVNNLLHNANKFTHEGGSIVIDLEEEEDFVLIKVTDNGIGIPADLQPHIFEKFTPARRPGIRGEEPVGLGLSIVKNMVELHHGSIWVTSEEGQGTTFFVEIPKE
ncbi:PAS domain-containing sensor histidine kinase [Adhaeribacter aquaticus]|uniref:PAS domain-containing sensor histidine kinase n=1 Tax=Adhaeribacter aquaticus TaxID=299567 RepID=UPI0004017F48|nr:PAS domain-containing sensor histidine kinase [Adhaeribacter aquaticus]